MTAPCMYLEHLNMPVALDGLCIELFVAATQVLHATRLQSLLLVVLDWDFEVKLSHSTARVYKQPPLQVPMQLSDWFYADFSVLAFVV